MSTTTKTDAGTQTQSAGSKPVPVTADNFNRAESDLYFASSVKQAGGVGKFHHNRELMPIDNQTVIRANRDMLYSAGVCDLDASPVTITLPDPGKCFLSMQVIDQDQYAPEAVYAPGTFTHTRCWFRGTVGNERRNNMSTFTQSPKASQQFAALVIMVAAALCITSCTTTPVSPAEPEKLVADARVTLSNFLRDPDQTWIQQNLNRARGVLIAPQIVRAGFIFGGSGGRGVLVSRDGRTWAGPAFYDLITASVGFQAGVDVSEVVVVVMTEKGLNSLLSPSFKVGGDASITAGPVGAAAASTVTADLVAFARSKGVYVGLNLDGAIVNTNDAWNAGYYGRNVLPTDILIRKAVTNPNAAPLLQEVASATR